jgi:hypothetical protein
MSCSDQVCSLSTMRPATALPQQQIAPLRRTVYESILLYYGNPVMYKIESPNPMFSMYAIGITSFCADRRYLIVVCPPDRNGLGSPMNLSQLNWVSFQARVSPTNYPVNSIYVEGSPNPFTESEIVQVPDENGVTTYQVVGYPMKVQLLGAGAGYRDRGTVGEALQTYSTVLFFA